MNIACVPFNESHTAQNIWNLVDDVLIDWKIENLVTTALRDNAANVTAAFFQPGCNIDSFGCFSHLLQLVIKDKLC